MRRRRDENPQKEMPFTAHLEELRWHILRSLVYVVVACCVVWSYYDPLYDLLSHPIIAAYEAAGFDARMSFFDILEPLLFKLQVVLAFAVIATLPLLIWEVWRFIAPGLYSEEKRYVAPLLPFSIVLCAAGVTVVYFALPIAFEFLLKFAPPHGAELVQHLQRYFMLLLRMMIGSAIAFQTPIVMLLLSYAELVTAAALLRGWRHAILICFTVAAIITPTIDPFNMSVIAVPLILLYLLSIGLVWRVDRRRERAKAKDATAAKASEPDGQTAPTNATEPASQLAPPAEATTGEPAPAITAAPPLVDRTAMGPLAAGDEPDDEDDEALFQPTSAEPQDDWYPEDDPAWYDDALTQQSTPEANHPDLDEDPLASAPPETAPADDDPATGDDETDPADTDEA